MVLYMAVTADTLELPVAVDETIAGLAKSLHITRNSISCAMHSKLSGKKVGLRFLKLELSEEERNIEHD